MGEVVDVASKSHQTSKPLPEPTSLFVEFVRQAWVWCMLSPHMSTAERKSLCLVNSHLRRLVWSYHARTLVINETNFPALLAFLVKGPTAKILNSRRSLSLRLSDKLPAKTVALLVSAHRRLGALEVSPLPQSVIARYPNFTFLSGLSLAHLRSLSLASIHAPLASLRLTVLSALEDLSVGFANKLPDAEEIKFLSGLTQLKSLSLTDLEHIEVPTSAERHVALNLTPLAALNSLDYFEVSTLQPSSWVVVLTMPALTSVRCLVLRCVVVHRGDMVCMKGLKKLRFRGAFFDEPAAEALAIVMSALNLSERNVEAELPKVKDPNDPNKL